VLVPHARYLVDFGGLTPEQAAPYACSGVTTYGALKKIDPAVRASEPVVLIGAGGLGLMAITVLKAMGGHGAISVDIDPKKREAALKTGALAAIDGSAPNAAQQIQAATKGGAYGVIDFVGSGATARLGTDCLAKGGHYVIVGLFGGEITLSTLFLPWRAITIQGSYVGSLGELKELMARARKAPLDNDTAEVLADLCNADLAAIRIEIEKLATYVGSGQPIRRADVDALVVSEKKYSVWELADMLATGQRAKALAFLDSLLREGEQPPALVGAMAWMYRTLLQVQELGPHVSGGQAAGILRMRRDTAEMAVRQARKIPRRQLVDGLSALYDADSLLKSGAPDRRAVMEFLVAQLMNAKPTPVAAGTQPASAASRK
jgi:hypothetical protein